MLVTLLPNLKKFLSVKLTLEATTQTNLSKSTMKTNYEKRKNWQNDHKKIKHERSLTRCFSGNEECWHKNEEI